jgi:hypothetical protein
MWGVGAGVDGDTGEPWRSGGATVGAEHWIGGNSGLPPCDRWTATYGGFNTALGKRDGGWSAGTPTFGASVAPVILTTASDPGRELGRLHNLNVDLGFIEYVSVTASWGGKTPLDALSDPEHKPFNFSIKVGGGFGFSVSSFDRWTSKL